MDGVDTSEGELGASEGACQSFRRDQKMVNLLSTGLPDGYICPVTVAG